MDDRATLLKEEGMISKTLRREIIPSPSKPLL